MASYPRSIVRFALVGGLLVTLAACTPLPPYDTEFTVTFDPPSGSPVTLSAAEAERPGIFGDLAGQGDQQAALWIFLDNGLAGDERLAYWYWRYDDGGTWVEELTVSFQGVTYKPGTQVVAGGADDIPDDLRVDAYSDGVGRVTGDIDWYTLEDATAATIDVRLTGLDALAYASSDADGDDPPIE